MQLSTENGPIKAGDELMLSSLPGVAMKATGTGQVIGLALEDFDDSRYYSETYLNQFGDDLVDPVYEPIATNDDPRLNDGCYYSGGTAVGEADCEPLQATTTSGQIAEANERAEEESVAEQLAELARERSERATLPSGETVRVGQVVMFVERSHRWLSDTQLASIQSLMGTSTLTTVGENETETVFDRLVALAQNFVDGVLTLTGLKADKIETGELCIDGVCVTGDELRALLDGQGSNEAQPDEVNTDPATDSTSGDTDTENDNNTAAAPATTTNPDETAAGSSTDEITNASTSSPDTAASTTDPAASSTASTTSPVTDTGATTTASAEAGNQTTAESGGEAGETAATNTDPTDATSTPATDEAVPDAADNSDPTDATATTAETDTETADNTDAADTTATLQPPIR